LEWVFCWGVFLGGVALIVFCFIYPIRTPENELTIVDGKPSDATLTTVTSRGAKHYTIKFSVDGYKTEYGSSQIKYDEVLAAVRAGQPLRIWVSTKQETLFPRAGWVPLYGLQIGDIVVLTYQEVVASEEEKGIIIFICPGVVLFVASVVSSYP
jgi:hypothetical protein